jgi:hypothetical protein
VLVKDRPLAGADSLSMTAMAIRCHGSDVAEVQQATGSGSAELLWRAPTRQAGTPASPAQCLPVQHLHPMVRVQTCCPWRRLCSW